MGAHNFNFSPNFPKMEGLSFSDSTFAFWTKSFEEEDFISDDFQTAPHF